MTGSEETRATALKEYLDRIVEREPALGPLLGAGWEAGLAAAAGFFQLVEFAAEDRILTQGESGSAMFLLLEGHARVEATPETGAATGTTDLSDGAPEASSSEVVRLAAPDVVGELAAVLHLPRSASVTAETGCRCLAIHGPLLGLLLEATPRICAALLTWIGWDVVDKVRRTEAHRPAVRWLYPDGSADETVATPAPEYLAGDAFRDYATPPTVEEKLQPKPLGALRAALEELGNYPWLCFPEPLPDRFIAAWDLSSAPANSLIVGDSESEARLLVLRRGHASLRGPEGEVLRTFEGGAQASERFIMGEFAFLCPTEGRRGTIVADTDCELLELERTRYLDLLVGEDAGGDVSASTRFAVCLAQALVRVVCLKLRETSERKARDLRVAQGDYALWFEGESVAESTAPPAPTGAPAPAPAMAPARPRADLEALIAERSQELTAVNHRLRQIIAEHERTVAELRAHRESLRSLAAGVALTEERERHRLAAVLHDTVVQSLAVAKLKLDALVAAGPSAEVETTGAEIREHIEASIAQSRSLLQDLSPPILYDLGLPAAVAWLGEQLEARHGLRCSVAEQGALPDLSEDVRVLLFQVVRELLTNVVKHAAAREVTVTLAAEDGAFRIDVTDDGAGFTPPATAPPPGAGGGFGLFSCSERLGHVQGRLELDAAPGRGTTATIWLPVDTGAGG